MLESILLFAGVDQDTLILPCNDMGWAGRRAKREMYSLMRIRWPGMDVPLLFVSYYPVLDCQ